MYKLKNRTPLRKMTRAQLMKYLALLALAGVIFMFFFSFLAFAWIAKDLPRPDKIVRKEGFATKIFDRNEKPLYEVFADQRRTPVGFSDIPETLRQATIAIEDKNFYKHQGFDPLGWLRAVYNIVVHQKLQGGSTLTQQLVKNVLLTPTRTLSRKIKEFVLAVQIEKKYSKDEILQMYLNEAPYGGTAWGVEAAAETYFGKKVSELNLIESAILAGLPQRPSYYSPFSDYPEAWKSRTTDVLRRMREDGYITGQQEEQTLEDLDKVEFASPETTFKAAHFVMYVKRILEEKYGERVVEQGGLRVYTTLDGDLQEEAEKIVKEEIAKVENIHITNGAAMVMDPTTGEILVMVGSKDFSAKDYDGQVNVALSLRQPGSAIKPVTYLTALRKGYTAATVISDVETHFPGGTGQKDYVPKNYDGKFHGPVQMRFALGSSLNLPAVKILAMVGLEDTLSMAYKLGFTTLEPTNELMNRLGLSFTLGGGEVRLLDMATAYSAFANSGYRVEPLAILKVEDQDGKTLEEHKPVQGKRVISEEEAFMITNILSDNNARLLTFGANSLLNISSRTVAVKTGTTNDMRDNWTVGWSPRFITGVWVGNNDNSAMKQVASGVSGASPIWRRIMLKAFEKNPVREFKVPDGVIQMDVDTISGYPDHHGYPTRKEYFIKGTEPKGEDPIHALLKVCKGDNGKLAPETLVAKGDYDEKEFIVLKEDDPVSSDGKNRWQEGIDAWIEKQSDQKYHYPREYCSASEEVFVRFRQPENQKKIDDNKFEVEIEAVSSNKIERVELFVNGDKKETFTSKPFKTNLVLSEGTYTLKAKADDDKGKSGETEIKIGVKVEWDWQPSPSPSPSPSPEPSPSPSPVASVVSSPL